MYGRQTLASTVTRIPAVVESKSRFDRAEFFSELLLWHSSHQTAAASQAHETTPGELGEAAEAVTGPKPINGNMSLPNEDLTPAAPPT